MDPVWANTWRRFFFLKARPLPALQRRTWGTAALDPTAWGQRAAPPDVDEDAARRMLAQINEREGHLIDYD
jgi:hypothetical protein